MDRDHQQAGRKHDNARRLLDTGDGHVERTQAEAATEAAATSSSGQRGASMRKYSTPSADLQARLARAHLALAYNSLLDAAQAADAEGVWWQAAWWHVMHQQIRRWLDICGYPRGIQPPEEGATA